VYIYTVLIIMRILD